MTDQIGKTLVIGGGISGIRASLDLAQAGFQVILMEQSDRVGGLLSQLDTQFPTSTCGMCRMLPMTDRDHADPQCLRRGLAHDNIEICVSTDLISLTGEPGNFTVSFIAQTDGGRQECPVLVVDDEKIVRDSMKEWLMEEGYPVQTAASAARALELLETGNFKAMLTDIKMPGMDGVTLLTRAKEIQPDLAVVMMTAYAAVDTAVEAMKQGALDYLVKPFDPDAVLLMVDRIYKDAVAKNARIDTVDAVILATGATFFHPDQGINPYGYGRIPGVVTNLEFERMLSHAGPGGMDLTHPVTGRPVTRIAWFQCVGSRDIQTGTPFCSATCCMISVKQSLMAKTMYPQVTEACVFYMDLRTWGKASDAYARQAETAGVRFVRARVHSLAPGSKEQEGAVPVVWMDPSGERNQSLFDLVVLAPGQHPDAFLTGFVKDQELATDDWGFVRPEPFLPAHTSRPGIFACGSATGPKDIHDSVTGATAAALSAMQVMTGAGRHLIQNSEQAESPVQQAAGISLFPGALVIGGGIAGMTAALAIANQGFEVDLVEKTDHLGGNLVWLKKGIQGADDFLEQQMAAVQAHDRIRVHTRTCAAETTGRPGRWVTRLTPVADAVDQSAGVPVRHGVVVLAVGGAEAGPDMDEPDQKSGLYTQQQFQEILDGNGIDSGSPLQVALFQCHGSREPGREYCSRVCCPRSLDQAMQLKSLNPDTRVVIFYRDMMTPGLTEADYAEARKKGVVFVPYEPGKAPNLAADDTGCKVTWTDPILGRPMEMDADYVVLAKGIRSGLSRDLAHMFEADLDGSGFFDQADIKWRPVEAMDPRVLACGICLEPGSLALTLASARAAAAKAISLLGRQTFFPSQDTARVRSAFCSLCRICIDACPFNARFIDPETRTLKVDPLTCQGCGICAAACPSGAAVVAGRSLAPMMKTIHAALNAPL
ncbi:FAD-dependent oxidoreductase [Desulfotignum balticum]|uniref:CoB--CoM heterodisulfide reductase iron-sulfur subunit A family protein n=1 Tax=Desulfotignum balticum TaxID=115781 RepID=A0A931CVU9_9BACT|nr:FAD-dependent oxidoreductase [Desulfotignum balticum]MBG0778341.1 CoB--CoM heterodisulfide reductase iron-sulfur subunit A family protein [Desulfotignum balticum]